MEPAGTLTRRTLLTSLAALAAATLACGRKGAADAPAGRRVVSLSPSTTEAVFALGAGAELVGRSRFCDFPPEATSLPAVGGFSDPNLEAIVALRPTLVIGARGPAGPQLEQTLQAHGADTFFPETESLAQIDAMLRDLGDKLGRGAEAARVIAAIDARVAAVRAAVASRPRVRAVMIYDVAPVFVAGPGSFPDELMRVAGGDNVVTVGGQYPTLDLERLVALAPDVIIDASTDMSGAAAASHVLALREAPGWRELSALREGRVRVLAAASALRPGPRIGDGLVAIARALHGDALALPGSP